MDLLKIENGLNLFDEDWKIYSVSPSSPAQYIGEDATVKNSVIVEGCVIHGTVENSVLFQGVYVGKNTVVKNSVIMPNSVIDDFSIVNKAIIGSDAIINKEVVVGNGKNISVVASKEEVGYRIKYKERKTV